MVSVVLPQLHCTDNFSCILASAVTKMAGSPFTKQLLVAVSPVLAGFSVGGAVTFPTVLLHQLQAEDSTIHLDFETASWIGAIQGLAGLPSIFMPTLMQWRGRKLAFIIACLISICGWILAYTANTSTLLLISESFHGLGNNSIYSVTFLAITEMIAPKYRDTVMLLYFAASCTSMAVSGLLIQYVHWKTICIIMCVPTVLALLIGCGWPESPYWLACKGEYRKCQQSFVWLRGTDVDSVKELSELIKAKKESGKDILTFKIDKGVVKDLWNKITRRDFYIPYLHIIVLEFLVYGTGGIIVLIYSIELFKKTTTNESVVFLGSFIANIIMLLGFAMHMCISKYFKNKTFLLCSIFATVISISIAALVSYLQDIGIISEESIACLICLIVYIISISSGIMPVAYPIASALMPVRHRGLGGVLYVTNTCMFHTLTLKLAPYMFLYIHIWGTFLVFAAIGIICGLIIWKYIPETKGRTLQEIDDFYTFGNFEYKRSTDENLDPMIVNVRCTD